jgi:hypothetical protein
VIHTLESQCQQGSEKARLIVLCFPSWTNSCGGRSSDGPDLVDVLSEQQSGAGHPLPRPRHDLDREPVDPRGPVGLLVSGRSARHVDRVLLRRRHRASAREAHFRPIHAPVADRRRGSDQIARIIQEQIVTRSVSEGWPTTSLADASGYSHAGASVANSLARRFLATCSRLLIVPTGDSNSSLISTRE